MLRRPDALLATALTALACGPGMGSGEEAAALLVRACALDMPLLLDADALNVLAADQRLAAGGAGTSWARRSDATDAASKRGRALAGLATRHWCRPTVPVRRCSSPPDIRRLVVLKGCGSIIATPAGRWFVNTSGNPGLATAGSGDVLSGFVVALLAQGWPELDALLAAVHLHGAAADERVAGGCGPIGLTAGELIDSARACFNRWVANGR
jgi:NAD(P)H-hydrate repair Nnr-like enzyme with NAD(P)H-hydrate dehydratase domain